MGGPARPERMAAIEPAAVRGRSSQPCPTQGHASTLTCIHVHAHSDNWQPSAIL